MVAEKIRKIKIKNFLLCLSLSIIGAILYAVSNPNPVIKKGFSVTAWFMYVPFLFLIKKSFLKSCWFYSGLYGALSVCLYAYWLYNYDSMCLLIAIPIAFIATALLGLLLKSVEKIFFKNAWLVQFLIICTFDYLRSFGFLGIGYGLAAYTQWKFNSLIQICSLIGVYGLNAFVILASAIIFAFVSKSEDRMLLQKKLINDDKHYDGATYINYVSENSKKLDYASLKIPCVVLCLWFIFFIFILIYGNIKLKKNQDYKTVTTVVVQHNDNPDENGLENFSDSVVRLMSLTDEALEINPDIRLVIWPENAFVPSVIYHYNQEQNSDRKQLVCYLLDYIQKHDVSFIIGNQQIEVNSSKSDRKIYTSSLLFDRSESVYPPHPEIYNKMKLVPFSEYFPYQKYFPNIYKAILQKQKFFNEPGNEIQIFKSEGLSVYTPICFENSFPSLCSKAYKKGARAFFCLVNDSWAKSESCQYEHLAMSKFRAVENNVPVSVSSVSGQTAFINQKGQIISMANPFTKTYLICEIPVLPETQKPTIYNKIGDIFGYGMAILLLVVLIIRGLIAIIK